MKGVAVVIHSEQLMSTIQQANRQKLTGIASVTVEDGLKKLYGTLWFKQGKIVSAQYLDLEGREAFNALSQVQTSSVSFAKTPVNRADTALTGVTASAQTEAKMAISETSKTVKFGIFPRVLLTVLFAALVPLAGLWVINYISIRREVQSNITARLGQTSDLVTSQVNDWLSTAAQGMQQASNLINMTELMAEPNVRHPVLIAMGSALAWQPRGIAVDPDGMQVGRADGVDPVFVGDREYFRQAVDQEIVGHQVIMSRTHGTPTLCLAIPHRQSGAVMGSIALCGDLADQIAEFLGSPRVGDSAALFITDASDRLIAHSTMTLPSEDFLDFRSHPAILAPTQQVITYDDNGTEKVAYTQTTDLGWTVVIEQTSREAFAELRNVERQAIILFALALVLVTVVSYLLARRFVKPIQHLTEVADGISKGQLDADITEVNRQDEIGELANAISRLRMSVQMAMRELAQR
jgi:methyl-accepting chemotaxis protein